MHKLYNGQITLQLSTIVEAQQDSVKERNSAHEAIDNDFLRELMTLVKAKGYFCGYADFDLQQCGEATITDLENLEKKVKEAKDKEEEIRGKVTVTKISF